MSRVVALVASHNRRERTLACLRSLLDQDVAGHDIEAIVVDDSSSDGTTEAVRELSDKVDVIRGGGDLYWAGAMALAEQHALARQPDYLLWLNDDVALYDTALATLMSARDLVEDRRIVVGSLVDPETGAPTYGGADRVDRHPMRFQLVAPTDGTPRPATTFNGNVALIPRPVYESVGGIDGRFAHAYADFDYGLRARSLGFESIVAGTAVGTCGRDPAVRWRDATLPLVTRYRLMLDRKGVPAGSYARYLRRHGGPLWPVYFLGTYLKVAADHVRARLARHSPSQSVVSRRP